MKLSANCAATTVLLCAAMLLTACAFPAPGNSTNHSVLAEPLQATVVGVRPHQVTSSEPSGVNTAVGAVAGGLVGHQIGKGKGKTLATLLGVAGGAMAGAQVNQHTSVILKEELTLSLADGRTFQVDVAAAGFQLGQQVVITFQGDEAVIQVLQRDLHQSLTSFL